MNSGECRYILIVDKEKQGDTAALYETFDIVNDDSPWNELMIKPISWNRRSVVMLDDTKLKSLYCFRIFDDVEKKLRSLIETGCLTEKGLNIKG